MTTSRASRRRFAPALESLSQRIAPALLGALPPMPADYTTPPARPTEITPPPPMNLLATTAPESPC